MRRHPTSLVPQRLDGVVSVGIAAHEGQLFGWPNQLLNLFTACGLFIASVSAVVLWWRRRSHGVLVAPLPLGRGSQGFGSTMVIVRLARCGARRGRAPRRGQGAVREAFRPDRDRGGSRGPGLRIVDL